jgi:hypothetical protein
MRRHIVRGTLLLALGAGLTGSASCTMRHGTSNSYLIIDSLSGFSGATQEETGSNLQSDVVSNGTAWEDEGIVTFRLGLKDPGSPTVPTVATTNNFITVTSYRVVYLRSDGRNTPGRDVPFPFDGALTATVRAEGTTSVNFSLVRPQAKLEPPLLGLRNLGGAGVISAIAEVTFFGRDQAGRSASAVGRISVDFGDF